MSKWTRQWQACTAPIFAPKFNRQVLKELEHPVYPLVIERLHDAGSILDVACGNCILYDYIVKSKLPVTYTGVDVTPKFVEYALTLYPALDVRVGDARSLPFDDASFDVAYCKDVLGHFPPQRTPVWKQVVTEMWRVARRRMLIAEFVFKNAATRYETDQYGFYQNVYHYPSFIRFLKQLPSVADLSEIPQLGYTALTLYVVEKHVDEPEGPTDSLDE